MTNALNKLKCLNSTHLKIIAMFTMLMDHLGKTLFISQGWLTCIGRLAFPIFAFQIAEGYNHTKDFKVYFKRMLIYALIAEIPYNVMAGFPINPAGQNVLFTFCISLLVIRAIDLSWQKNRYIGILVAVAATFAGYVLAFLFMTDYMGYGVLTVVAFWAFGKIKFGWIAQIISIVYINWFMIAGESFTLNMFGRELWVPIQAIGILSLIPIFLYNGKKGPGGKTFQRAVYIFYPAHMLILGILMFIFMA